ncbi:MAG: hypothetical protein LBT87_00165 [Treponema sp.]|jgi:hypothetical protein|nr:hypothetical protein [Treponema sp.]
MAERIIHLEVEGKAALGFDTGLSSQAFAQAKFAQSIVQEGRVVYPDGKIENWQASGVLEYKNGESPTMVIWGPAFPGERLDLLAADPARRDEALEALRYWMAARSGEDKGPGANGYLVPAGALVVTAARQTPRFPRGTLLFSPERLAVRCLQAEGEDRWREGAESLINPELGGEAAVFTAGALLYRILTGQAPFPNRNIDLLHQDIREGVFLPARFAAPGLDEDLAKLMDRAMAGLPAPGSAKTRSVRTGSVRNSPTGGIGSGKAGSVTGRPDLGELAAAIGPAGSGGAALFFRPLDEETQERLAEERAQLEKKRKLTVNTRRFVIRNSAILGGSLAALVALLLVAYSIIAGRKDLPTTRGMEPLQVIEAYYNAFGELDHTMMDACVINKAGKRDIEMVTNFFVLSRVRQAYEYVPDIMLPAQKWRDQGSPLTKSQVFGVTDLDIRQTGGDERADQVQYRASYTLWIPAESDSSADPDTRDGPSAGANPAAEAEQGSLPRGYPITDELTMVRRKGDWRISGLERESAL